jgi:reactive intermediate/imine deaminase
MKIPVSTKNAPSAIGPYSQAIKHKGLLYLSGQIALAPGESSIENSDANQQIDKVFTNIELILVEAGGGLNDILKLNIYLTNLENFDLVNKRMEEIFEQPYPARATLEVSSLPKGAIVEIDAIAKCD